MKTGQGAQNAPDMEKSLLHEFFLEELKDIYWAEKHLVKNLPKMAAKTTSAQLRQAIESHLRETEGHVTRLEEVFENLGEKAETVKCDAMDGLVDEANEIIGDTKDGSMVRDAGIIMAAQKVEHYEIATYGALKTLAKLMGHTRVEELLEDTLREEKKADDTLTQLAESYVNSDALKETK